MKYGNRAADKAVFRYFDSEVKSVAVPPPHVPESTPASGRPPRWMLRNLAVHAAVAAVCIALVAALPASLRAETPLRQAIRSAAQEKTYLRYLPSAETLRESAIFFINRRNKT
jgi:hypothetical protein